MKLQKLKGKRYRLPARQRQIIKDKLQKLEDGAIFYNDDYQDEIEDKNKVEKEIKDISKKKGKKTCFFVNKKTFQSKANRPLVNRQGGVPKWSGHM